VLELVLDVALLPLHAQIRIVHMARLDLRGLLPRPLAADRPHQRFLINLHAKFIPAPLSTLAGGHFHSRLVGGRPLERLLGDLKGLEER
jgi:hypothetical protein